MIAPRRSKSVLFWSRAPRLIVGPLFFLASVARLNAEALPEEPRRNFEEFYKFAVEQGFQLGEQRSKIEFSKAREDLVESKATPNLSLEVLSGPIPGATGNSVTGNTDWDRWGPFVTAKADLTQALYTFGAIGEGEKAAAAGTAAETYLLEKEKWTLRTQIGELYYGYQVAFEFSLIAEDFEKKIEKALQMSQKRRVSRNDMEKLKSAYTEAKIRRMEAEKGIEMARAAMAWKLGLYGKAIPKWDRANLEPRNFPIPVLEEVIRKAEASRPEIKALQKEVEAKRALAQSESAQDYPVLFLGARASYGYTPVREVQKSPFAYDPFNTMSGGAALGLKWNLSFWERSAKVSQARAEAKQAESKFYHLKPALLVDVEKSYRDLKHSYASMDLRNQAAKSTRSLYQDTVVAYGLGTGSAKDFLEAAGNYALSEKNRLDAVFSYNMNTLKLEQTVGSEQPFSN